MLWIGGNDAHFFKTLDGCVYNFYGPFSIGCTDAIRDTLLTLQTDEFRQHLTTVYAEILQAANPKAEHFTLYVLGYPRFWNQDTSECDTSRMAFWNWYPGPELLQENRRDMNDLTLELNNVIKDLVARIGAGLVGDSRRIRYIDTDPVFEGHRFCEPGSKELNPSNPNNYFFQLYDLDLSPDGTQQDNLPFWPNSSSTGVASLPNADACKFALQEPGISELDYGEIATCEISVVLQRYPNVTLDGSAYKAARGSDYSQAAYGRIFHPKSMGYTKVKDLIMAKIKADEQGSS